MHGYRTKKELIYHILKEDIVNGKYEFNERLVISRLAKEFNSSEIPVREALNQLNADGLVEFKNHVGPVVSTLSFQDLKEILEVRIALEALATKLALKRIGKEQIRELQKMIDDSKVAFNEKKYNRYEELNVEFHMYIYKFCDNKLLLKNIQDLWSNTNRYPSLFDHNDEHIKLSIKEHENILEAISNRNSNLAEECMTEHKARATDKILKNLISKKSSEQKGE